MPKVDSQPFLKKKRTKKSIRNITTCSPFMKSQISDSKVKVKGKSKGRKSSAKGVPDTIIPKTLVNKLVGVLKGSEKGVRKNMRKSSSIETYTSKEAHNL